MLACQVSTVWTKVTKSLNLPPQSWTANIPVPLWIHRTHLIQYWSFLDLGTCFVIFCWYCGVNQLLQCFCWTQWIATSISLFPQMARENLSRWNSAPKVSRFCATFLRFVKCACQSGSKRWLRPENLAIGWVKWVNGETNISLTSLWLVEPSTNEPWKLLRCQC